jgi:hypothetical protein
MSRWSRIVSGDCRPAQRQVRIERAKARLAGKHSNRTDAALAALAAK